MNALIVIQPGANVPGELLVVVGLVLMGVGVVVWRKGRRRGQ